MKLTLNKKFKSLDPFSIELPDFVVLTGINGAGKTQLLTAMASFELSVADSAGIELNPKKYVNSQTLSPNEITIVTREELNLKTKNLWDSFNNYREGKSAIFEIGTFEENTPQSKIVQRIAINAKKTKEELTSDDFFHYYPIDDELSKSDVFYQNFSSLFKRYQDKLEENSYREFRSNKGDDIHFLSREDFEEMYGEAPWEFANKIIREASLDYHISSPENNHRDAPFELKLVSNFNGAEIQFNDLSSGEKVLMSLALALYNSNFDVEFPKVLLMDEPDASLHPSMSKKFLDVIQNVFVKEKNVKVIITTHSPSTVAIAPEESIFVVNKEGERIEKVNKDKALKILTAGVPSFSVNYENRRQVFVESQYDVVYYEKLYQKLSGFLIPEISLSFISSGESKTDKNGTKVSNCGQVINITTILREAGNTFVSGIIDWDKSNVTNQYIKVIGDGNRYSIENYIFDPLFVVALLLREKLINKEELNLAAGETYVDFKHFKVEKLQYIADWIIAKVESHIKPSDNMMVESELVNGVSINLPLWYLHLQGHQLEEVIIKLFPQLGKIKRGGGDDVLKIEIIDKVIDDLVDIMPIDVLNVLRSVQIPE